MSFVMQNDTKIFVYGLNLYGLLLPENISQISMAKLLLAFQIVLNTFFIHSFVYSSARAVEWQLLYIGSNLKRRGVECTICSFIYSSAGAIKWQPCCFATILLIDAFPKIIVMLVLFVIFGA